jgi:hypothetical protein
MGSFYTSITLLGPDQDQVAEYLGQQGLRAYVSPTVRRVTVIGEAQCDMQKEDVLEALAAKLSKQFDCPALAVLNHDDDVLLYKLYTGGTLSDAYDSTPGYFEGAESPVPKGGNARLLCNTFGVKQNADGVEKILRSRSGKSYVFALDRHRDLAEALGLPAFSVAFGYEYLASGELPDSLAAEALKHTGAKRDSSANSYANMVVRGANQDQITDYLSRQGWTAYISPTMHDITVVYEKLSDLKLRQASERLAARLSDQLGCIALAVQNGNDIVLRYKLYVGGILFDEYETMSESTITGGSAQALCRAFGVEPNAPSVERILGAPGVSGYSLATLRHADLANALGLPAYAVGLGYRQIEGGEVPDSLARNSLRRTGEK